MGYLVVERFRSVVSFQSNALLGKVVSGLLNLFSGRHPSNDSSALVSTLQLQSLHQQLLTSQKQTVYPREPEHSIVTHISISIFPGDGGGGGSCCTLSWLANMLGNLIGGTLNRCVRSLGFLCGTCLPVPNCCCCYYRPPLRYAISRKQFDHFCEVTRSHGEQRYFPNTNLFSNW